ncbi:hypothetical protein SLA2020_239010 [Shorea laevis]
MEKVKTGSKKSRYRSRSHSSSTGYSESIEYQSEDSVVEQSNSRRLRLVISVFKEEGMVLEGDEHKEEIIYGHDDYPSSKSNDSNDKGIRREFPQHLHVAHEKIRMDMMNKEKKLMFLTSESTVFVVSGKDSIYSCDVVGKDSAAEEKKSDASRTVGTLDVDDLETVLRHCALENLRKFRGGMQTSTNIQANQKDKNNANVNTLSKEKPESVWLKSTIEDGSRVVTASQSSQQPKLLATRKNSSGLPPDRKNSEGNNGGRESLTADHVVTSARDQVAPACIPEEKVNDNVAINSDAIRLKALRRESPKTNSTLKQGSASQAMLIPRSKGNEIAVESAKSVEPQSDNNNSDETKNVHDSTTSDDPSSCPGSMLVDVSSGNLQHGTKEGLQFKQKTMSVMRGGELVQVNYKVYIPKKDPALARRQLKR